MGWSAAISLKGSTIKMTNPDNRFNTTVERIGNPNAIAGATTFTDGNGSYQGNQGYSYDGNLAAGASLYIDLRNGTGSPKDMINADLSLATVKMFMIEITEPSANQTLRVGPAGNSSGAPLWFANNTQSETVHDLCVKTNPISGWTVASGAGNLCITNTGNATCAFKVRIGGVKAA